MKRLYWLVNKPWESFPIVVRAIRLSHYSRQARDAAHIQWAHSLLNRMPERPAICDDAGPFDTDGVLPYKPPVFKDENGEAYRVMCERKP